MKKIFYLLLILLTRFYSCEPVFAQRFYTSGSELILNSFSFITSSTNINLSDGIVLDPGPGDNAGGITIPTDSLRLAINFTSQFGLPASVFGATIPSLYHGTNAMGDTLTQINCTDSTAFGYVYTNGSNANLTTPQRFYIDSSWTLIFKTKGFANGIIMRYNNSDQCYLFSDQNCTFHDVCQGASSDCGSSGSFNYYSAWAIKGDDSATAIVHNGTGTFLYRIKNGVATLRATSPARTNTILTNSELKFGSRAADLFFKGEFWFIYFYNRAVLTTEMILFSP